MRTSNIVFEYNIWRLLQVNKTNKAILFFVAIYRVVNDKVHFYFCSKYYQFMSWMCHRMAFTDFTVATNREITIRKWCDYADRDFLVGLIFFNWSNSGQLHFRNFIHVHWTKKYAVHSRFTKFCKSIYI